MKQSWMERGRSMVEMLGVLAVVGLLSIVGIYGYKKAMIKIRANELMDMAMKVHNENLAWLTLNPTATTTNGSLCSNSFPDSVTAEAAVKTKCNSRNLALDKPTWAKLDSFAVRSNVRPNATGTYHNIIFHGVGDCDICKEIADMTEKVNTSYAHIPRTTPDTRIYCYKGTNTKTDQTNCMGVE